MTPIEFPEQDRVFAENQDQYGDLPSLKLDTKEGEVISCWKLTLKERIMILFTGKIWMCLWSFNKPLMPSSITAYKEEFIPTNQEPKR